MVGINGYWQSSLVNEDPILQWCGFNQLNARMLNNVGSWVNNFLFYSSCSILFLNLGSLLSQGKIGCCCGWTLCQVVMSCKMN